MLSRLVCLLILGATCACGLASAQQRPQAAADSGGVPARIKCQNEPYVTITSDAEQALPLRLVATAACNESVIALSDTQGYTVKVQTASGKIGYVTRYEIVVDTSMREASPAQSASAGTNGNPNPNPNQMQSQQARPPVEPSPAPDEKGLKPRVYITDTETWAEIGGFGNPSGSFGGSGYAPGYNPDMVSIYQDFTSDCAVVAVTQEKSKADFAVLFDKATGKKGFTGFGGLVKVNKVTVVTRGGETLVSQALHSEDATVKLACDAIGQRLAAGGASQTGKAVQ
jgi:hypothetical protein